mgnify:CR=1 FL=1
MRGGVALWTLFLGFAMLMVGNGLNLAVLGVRMVDEGFGVRTSGVVMACYFAGFLLGPVLVVRWLSGVGHVRMFASLASLASCVVLVHFVWVNPLSWGVLRFVSGFCMAGLYVVVESWLNAASTPATRGRTLAVYTIASMGGLGVGQLLIATGDPREATLFIVASILVSMSFVPIALAATTDAPPVRVSPMMKLREFHRVAPTGMVGTFFTGASHGILFGLSAVYATRAGFGPGATAAFLALPSIGARYRDGGERGVASGQRHRCRARTRHRRRHHGLVRRELVLLVPRRHSRSGRRLRRLSTGRRGRYRPAVRVRSCRCQRGPASSRFDSRRDRCACRRGVCAETEAHHSTGRRTSIRRLSTRS